MRVDVQVLLLRRRGLQSGQLFGQGRCQPKGEGVGRPRVLHDPVLKPPKGLKLMREQAPAWGLPCAFGAAGVRRAECLSKCFGLLLLLKSSSPRSRANSSRERRAGSRQPGADRSTHGCQCRHEGDELPRDFSGRYGDRGTVLGSILWMLPSRRHKVPEGALSTRVFDTKHSFSNVAKTSGDHYS